MTLKIKKMEINNTPEAWENSELGCDLEFAVLADTSLNNQIDDALGLQMISIRLEKDLIHSFKLLGAKYDLGYQPLMREALKRFVDGEFKLIASQVLEKQKLDKQKTTKRIVKVA